MVTAISSRDNILSFCLYCARKSGPGGVAVAQFIGFRFQVSGFGCQGTEVLSPDIVYETHSWNSEPQNIEQEISNEEVWIHCAQSFLKIIMIEYLNFDIRCSLFDIHYSFFIVSFSIRLAAFQARGWAEH